jgi:heme-degrading monooxygenase HmoA
VIIFVVFNELQVPAEDADVLEREFDRAQRTTLPGFEGLYRSALLRPTEAGRPYLATMEFSTEDAYRAWLASDAFRAAHPGDSAGESAVRASEVHTYTVRSAYDAPTAVGGAG